MDKKTFALIFLTISLLAALTDLVEANTAPNKPSIPDGPIGGKSGISYTYSTHATDPDGDRVKYTFDWGDGTTSTTAYVSSGAIASMSHTWTIPPATIQSFNLTVRATDEFGLSSGWCSTVMIMIMADREDHPPTIPSTPTGPTTGVNGTTYYYSTVSTDLDGDWIKYLFSWGDGGSETDYYHSGVVVTANHSWNNVPAGATYTYQVKVFAADSRNFISPDPHWSDSLNVSITGGSATTTSTSTTRPTTTSSTTSSASTTTSTTSTSTSTSSSSTTTSSTFLPPVLVSCGANVSVVYRGQNILLSQNVTLASYSISRAWFQLNYSVNYTGSGNTTTSFWRVLDTSALLGNYSLRCWVNDTQNNRVYLDNSSFMVVSTTTTTTYSSASSTTSTTMQQCIMPGKYPPCAEVALSEVVAAINRWAAGEFALGDVINLINSWADPSAYPPN